MQRFLHTDLANRAQQSVCNLDERSPISGEFGEAPLRMSPKRLTSVKIARWQSATLKTVG